MPRPEAVAEVASRATSLIEKLGSSVNYLKNLVTIETVQEPEAIPVEAVIYIDSRNRHGQLTIPQFRDSRDSAERHPY